jgi:hypothetical protein
MGGGGGGAFQIIAEGTLNVVSSAQFDAAGGKDNKAAQAAGPLPVKAPSRVDPGSRPPMVAVAAAAAARAAWAVPVHPVPAVPAVPSRSSARC